ncbi:putative cleavage and polyadenylation specificity factor subunit protein [Neofusicoccum parvum UCRNP2]|uniref:Putative cleavage and polyadenylation specificity factor subunit protein n=1 Tax=Botryosphaeria parva (strain UCR-NP2) TaxID=1287680 RepID=R1EZS3_BOTPV|nr:putative cleavage and polyadenylation specificity factor subunit protein [Neofusicoccum parvum UCRNP2]
MQVYTELTPPTAVSNAVSLAFLGPRANNLVVAKTSLLQVFELKSIVTEVGQAPKDGLAAALPADDAAEPADLFVQRTEHTSKLVLVAEYPLQGTVLSLARIKALDTKSGGDALLIAFRDAKMSLVEWDPANHTLSTISIHFYEGEELQGAPWDAELGQYHNFLVADPSSRCAALKFGARHLAILPFRQIGDDLVEGDDYDPDFDEPMDAPAAKEKVTNGDVPQTPYKSSFALSLPQIDPTLTHPVHLDFLHEYREPTFGIISANKAAAASLLYERRDILTYTVFTLDLEEKASTALLSMLADDAELSFDEEDLEDDDDLYGDAPIKDMAIASHKLTDAAAGAVWSVHAKKPAPKGMVPTGPQDAEAKLAADVDYDRFLIVSRSNSEGGEESAVFNITATGFEETSQGDFEREDAATINVGTIAGGTRIVQVLKAEIRSYDSELGLDQILPMEDENGSELRIISASFADPYILVIRDDSSVIVLQADANGEMEEIDRGDTLLSTKWLSGCIHQSPSTGDKALAYLLTAEGGLHVFELPDLSKPAYVAASLGFLLPILTADFTPRRSSAKAALTEILVAELGDSTSKSPYLIVRTSSNDLVIYQPYHFPAHETVKPFFENLRWLKVTQPRLPEFTEEPALESEEVGVGRESILSAVPNVGGYREASVTEMLAGLSGRSLWDRTCKQYITFKPQVEHGAIKVLDAQSLTVIDTYELEAFEVVLTVKVLNLEVSENTHERKQLIAVGTGFIRGEDLPSRGCIYILEVINVVPEPGHPETNRKLKLIAKEEVRGSVTAITDVGSQGFLLMAQGQKCMVRGLKEDGTLLPVAFMDMQCYVTVARELKGSGMLLMGDAAKGAWFVGYTEDPYKMILFGKSRSHMEVMAADFLPHDKQLYLMVADADCNLHVLQYDPEHPKSLSGQRLLHKSTFHTGHFTTAMTLLPSSLSPTSTAASDADADANPDPDAMAVDDPSASTKPAGSSHHLLLTSLSGAVALVTPVDEQMYRRLGALQTFLVGGLDHPCGLNPRAYRAVESEGFGSRGVVDGALLARWAELGSQRRAEGCAKVGVEEWVVRSDLEFVGGAGLEYL